VEVATPTPGPGELRAKVAYVGVCGSDVTAFLGHRPPHVRHGRPVIGHELSGVVDLVGAGVTGIRPGDRVTCIEGWGALADYVITTPQESMVFDDRIGLEDGCLLEVLPGAAMAAWRTGIDRRSQVLIIGQGLSGLLITRLASVHGCRQLVVVDPDPAKLELAREFGATDTVQGLVGDTTDELARACPAGFDVAIVATLSSEPIRTVVPLLRPRARIVAYGGLEHDARLDVMALHRRSVTLVKESECVNGVLEARQVWREAVELAYAGVLPLSRLRTHTLDMRDAQAALDLRARGTPGALHVVLRNSWVDGHDGGTRSGGGGPVG
jgi:threonine dehydrogenase-like Zn-dependent dehydrogenase